METPYSKAWKAFIESDRARQLLSLMAVYNENKLREAFDAGWNARNHVESGEGVSYYVGHFSREDGGSNGL